MRSMLRGKTLLGILLVVTMTLAASGQVSTTQVSDTIYRADGATETGTVLVSWETFTTAAGQAVAAGATSVTIPVGGVLSVALVPDVGANPAGSYYTAVYHLDDGRVLKEFWAVPVSAVPVALSTIRSTVLPLSVAMQTVSRSYVDTAIAAAVTGHPLDSSPYVQRAGDAMTGPLVLVGDPVAGTQAADKNYVDVNVASIAGSLGQKVSILPSATQTVVQPAGTELQVNKLNGVLYASQYVNGHGGNGIANALASPDCGAGCAIQVNPDDAGENYRPTSLASQTLVVDDRGGERRLTSLNPLSQSEPGINAAAVIDSASTLTSQQGGSQNPTSIGLRIRHAGLTGGSNLYAPAASSVVPYFKTTYSAVDISGTYNTPGQHILMPQQTNCYGVGDCLFGAQQMLASGGVRDSADEGAHPFDIQIHEDWVVFTGTCSLGCTTGSTQVTVAPSTASGTQGEGRYLIDKNPAKLLTDGVLTGGVANSGPHASAQFSGSHFPVSVFFQTAQAVNSQVNDTAPGMLNLSIATTGVPTGYQMNTAAAPGASGVACLTDQPAGGEPQNYEMANYLVVDGTHIQLTMNKPHAARATIAIGGLCGYGLEQTVDTQGGIRQVFPVVGSSSSTMLYYMSGYTAIVGMQGSTSAFVNLSSTISSVVRSGNVVTLTVAGNLPYDVNGLSMTVAGVSDSSYNGTFRVTTTAGNSLTYAETGSNSSSAGGTIGLLTGGYVLYPMAEVLGVYNAATGSVDGKMRLAPNTVAWAANDAVEQPHYFQEKVGGDIEFIGQTVPRPVVYQEAGIWYEGNNGPGLHGWTIQNTTSANQYMGYGGTHAVPDMAYELSGLWKRSMVLEAGEQAAFSVGCNAHGCSNWNSAYNLFELSSSGGADVIQFQPNTSTLVLGMRGAVFSFSPQAFTAGTINVGTLNATTINGSVSGGVSGAATLTGGTIDGATIGATARAAGSFTTLAVGPGVNLASNATAVVASSGLQTFEVHGTNPANKRSAFTFANNYGGTSTAAFEFGTDLEMNGSQDFYVYNYATGNTPIHALANDDVVFGGKVTAANFNGVLSGTTGSIGGSGLTAGTCASGTVGVAGAGVGRPVIVAASDGSLPSGLVMLSAAVTSANTVTVQVCAVAAMTPAAKTYSVRVIE